MQGSRGFNIWDAYRAARTQLTVRESDLVYEVLGRRASPDEEAHRVALSRFDAAYAEVAVELRLPFLTAADFLL